MSQKKPIQIPVDHFGAIRPPWIDKQVFYKLPFNFCDRWCERCKLHTICRVYQNEVNRKRTGSAFKSLVKDFKEMNLMLKKDLRKHNIKITKKDLEESEKEEKTTEDRIKKDRLYLLCIDIKHLLNNILEDIHQYFFGERPLVLDEAFEILTYYTMFITPKIYRSILSEIEESSMIDDTTNDSKTSAFLASGAIDKINNTLLTITKTSGIPLSIKNNAQNLVPELKKVNELIIDRFDLFNVLEPEILYV